MLALPSSVTEAPESTVWSAPASAVGGSLFCTVTDTVSAVEASPPGSVTVRLKVSVSLADTAGAVKVGEAALALFSVTVVPTVWVQAWVRVRFSGSVLALASSVTVVPSNTVWSSPASAVGAVFAVTVRSKVSVTASLSVSVAVRV